MKKDQIDRDIMDYLDGLSVKTPNKEAADQASELKQILDELKEMPFEKVNSQTDKRIFEFIENQDAIKDPNSRPVIKLKNWLPHVVAAASIVVIFFIFNKNNNLEDDYQLLQSNPDKLSFIYSLNEQQLSSEEISWLKEEFEKTSNPNIKVTLVDLLNNNQSYLDTNFFNILQEEDTPSVQMALLNALENSEHLDFTNALLAFSKRNDLDNSVELRAMNILSNKSKNH